VFGYVRIFKPELKMLEFEQYQGVYCSLCRCLGRRYGPVLRLTLSYDFTFLALLGMALRAQCADFAPARCALHPTRRRLCCRDDASIELAADAAALLVYYKTKDTLADEGFWRSLPARLLLPFAAAARKRAARRRPELDAAARACMADQAAMEQAVRRAAGETAAETLPEEKTAAAEAQATPPAPYIYGVSLDRAADPSARLLAALAAALAVDEAQRPALERLGYCLGRWVYLVDALDDWQEDGRRGRFNPYGGRDPRAPGLYSLNACLAECREAYDALTVYRFDGILRNILEQGMPAAQQRAAQKECQHERQRSV